MSGPGTKSIPITWFPGLSAARCFAYLGDVHLQCAARADIEEPPRFHIRSSSASVGSMGIDVNMYVAGAVTEEEFDHGRGVFGQRMAWAHDNAALMRGWEDRIELDSWDRYWGPGYERGPWPLIHAQIIALRAAFPGHTIHYGGDSDWENAPEATDELLAEYWAHWQSPQWDDYHDRMRAAFPGASA